MLMKQENSSYIEIGKQLAARRKELNITISSASSALRIRHTYLKAIENGKIEELPPGIYKDGYIKSYAEFLELELDLGINGHKTSNTEQLEAANRNIRPQMPKPNKSILWLSTLAVILVNAVLYFIK